MNTPFTDRSAASRLEKAKRFLESLSDPRDFTYFYDDGHPRQNRLGNDAKATLEVLGEIEKCTKHDH